MINPHLVAKRTPPSILSRMPFTQLAEVNEVASIGEEECVWLQKVPVLDQF